MKKKEVDPKVWAAPLEYVVDAIRLLAHIEGVETLVCPTHVLCENGV